MNTASVKRFIIIHLPYVFLFWLFDKIGEAVRTAPGRDLLQRLMRGIGNINATFLNPLPSLDPQDLLVGLVGAAGIFYAVLYKKHNAKNWRKDIEYGSARWSA
jgi:type IV secretion system protein VirD4